jgi:hypothetical protein
MKLLQDRVGTGGPAKRLGVRVVVADKLVDALDELLTLVNRLDAFPAPLPARQRKPQSQPDELF